MQRLSGSPSRASAAIPLRTFSGRSFMISYSSSVHVHALGRPRTGDWGAMVTSDINSDFKCQLCNYNVVLAATLLVVSLLLRSLTFSDFFSSME